MKNLIIFLNISVSSNNPVFHPFLHLWWGVKGGVSECFLRVQSYSFGNWGLHAKFQNPSTAPSGKFWVGFFLFLLLPRENKVNSQVYPGMGVGQQKKRQYWPLQSACNAQKQNTPFAWNNAECNFNLSETSSCTIMSKAGNCWHFT